MITEIAVLIFLILFFKNPNIIRSKRFKEYQEIIHKINAEKFNNKLPENILFAIMLSESSGNYLAKGSSGEIGLTQVMPETFKYLDQKYNLNFSFTDLYIPKLALYAEMLLFNDYLKQLNYDVYDTVRAYNRGVKGSKQGKGYDYLQKVWSKL